MGKLCTIVSFTFLFVFPFTTISHAENTPVPFQKAYQVYDPEMDCTKVITLSKYQKMQLDRIYWNIYKDYSQLIEAYAWAGALTTEQKQFRYKMLRNYYQTFYNRGYRWCSEHEPDEWEEEWYNSDND